MDPILVADDEPAICSLVCRVLTEAGYPCCPAQSGRRAADLAESRRFSLALLDIMMPEVDGYDLLRYLQPLDVPVIFLTAKADLASRVQGLRLGADDYIVKPFAPAELLARVESVLRRTGHGPAPLRVLDAVIDPGACQVRQHGRAVALTPKEYELLLLLARNQGAALYRDYLYDTLWGDEEMAEGTRTLDTHIQRLRRKLGWEQQISTVYRIGYRLEKGPVEGD